MWIRTQNRQRIINSNQIIDIHIDNTGTKIVAYGTHESGYIILGEYKDRDTCLEILELILTAIGRAKMPGITMPFGGDVENWKVAIEELAKIYIIQDFRK